jgi:hypothetical protein
MSGPHQRERLLTPSPTWRGINLSWLTYGISTWWYTPRIKLVKIFSWYKDIKSI